MSFNPKEHMMNLKGKDYLEIKWRIVWMREEHPEWSIQTNIIEVDATHAIFKATINGDKGTIATAHGSETKTDFGDYIEKAESKAIGRALAFCGYGTQFSPDLEEGQRIVDSPVDRSIKPAPSVFQPKATFSEVSIASDNDALTEAMNYIPFKNGLDAGKAMKDLAIGKLEWLLKSDKTGERTKEKARLVLAARQSNGHSSVPMPTDADAPDEKLANEEPPW